MGARGTAQHSRLGAVPHGLLAVRYALHSVSNTAVLAALLEPLIGELEAGLMGG